MVKIDAVHNARCRYLNNIYSKRIFRTKSPSSSILCTNNTCIIQVYFFLYLTSHSPVFHLSSPVFTCLFGLLMPRSHINRAPYDFPNPAACRGFRDLTGTVRFSFLRHVWSHILRRPGGARRKLVE